jgi:aryl-alcohol dehydrogenase-like predicted oxidoreductase
MTISRRNLIKWGTGAGLAAASGAWGPLMAGSSELIMTTIPSTGEQVPSIGIGTVDFRGKVGSPDYQRLTEVFKAFHDGGGRLIDTSPNYGNSEVVMGNLMKDAGLREKLFVATKVDRETREEGIKRMDESFLQLGGDQIDLMQVHNLRGTNAQLETMSKMKAEGKLRYIGITTHTSNQYEAFEAAMRAHKLDFIQVNYSLSDREAEKRILPLAQEQGLGVLVNRPFNDGKMFSAVVNRPLPDWAVDIDCQSWGQVFLKYLISHPAATIPIPGTTKPHHAADNVGAMKGRLPDAALRKEMESLMEFLLK